MPAGIEEVDIYFISFPVGSEGRYKNGKQKKWCLIVLIRIVLWVRFGLLCGVLATPPVEMYASAGALVDFFLKQIWPSHACSVLLLGQRSEEVAKLSDIRGAFNAKGQQARAKQMRGTELTGSQRYIMEGMNVADFVKNPKNYDDTPLVKRAAQLAWKAGVEKNVAAVMSRDPKSLTDPRFSPICYP